MLASWGHLAIFQSTPKFKRLPIQVKSINSVHVQQSKYSFHFLSSGLILIQFIFVFVFHFCLSFLQSDLLRVIVAVFTSVILVNVFSVRYQPLL